MLWIAFVLCTFGLIYSHRQTEVWGNPVVNCFRSLYLWVDLQRPLPWCLLVISCELLSFFVPLGWFTASSLQVSTRVELWIAFVLCTFGLIYSIGIVVAFAGKVVNCFRSLYLWVDLQLPEPLSGHVSSCELLSFFVPLGWFTALPAQRLNCCPLWIAFVLCTFGLIYSNTWWPPYLW